MCGDDLMVPRSLIIVRRHGSKVRGSYFPVMSRGQDPRPTVKLRNPKQKIQADANSEHSSGPRDVGRPAAPSHHVTRQYFEVLLSPPCTFCFGPLLHFLCLPPIIFPSACCIHFPVRVGSENVSHGSGRGIVESAGCLASIDIMAVPITGN